MILLIILEEILLENIRQNDDIKRFAIGKKELKTPAFADSTTIYIVSSSSLAHLEIQPINFEKATDIVLHSIVF